MQADMATAKKAARPPMDQVLVRMAAEVVLDVAVEAVEVVVELAAAAAMAATSTPLDEQKSTRVVLDARVASLEAALVALVWAAAIFSVSVPNLASSLVVLAALVTVFCSFSMASHSDRLFWTEQYAVRVVLEARVSSSVTAAEALAWMAATLVALFLALFSSLVVLAARAMSDSSSAMVLQSSSISSTAKIWLQAVIRVVLVVSVARDTAAADALDWTASIFVALFFSLASSLVVLEASSTRALSLAICLHCDLVEVVPFLARAEPARERTNAVVNFILIDVEGLRSLGRWKMGKKDIKKDNILRNMYFRKKKRRRTGRKK